MTVRRRNNVGDAFNTRSDHEGHRPVVGVDVGHTAQRTTPFKISVKLPPPTYKKLRLWLIEQSGGYGGQVDANAVGVALFEEMFSEGGEELIKRVLARVREQKSQ